MCCQNNSFSTTNLKISTYHLELEIQLNNKWICNLWTKRKGKKFWSSWNQESLLTSVLSRAQEINGRILKNLNVTFEQRFKGVKKVVHLGKIIPSIKNNQYKDVVDVKCVWRIGESQSSWSRLREEKGHRK